MADFLNAHLVVKELSARIQSAWSLTASKVYDYRPFAPVSDDHAVIIASGGTKAAAGAKCRSYTQGFAIIGQFAYTAESFTEFKTLKANTLLSAIYSDLAFKAGAVALGSLFDVDDVEFEEIGEDHDRRLEIRISFRIQTPQVAIPV
jgi:hypothetical protein